MSVSSSPSTVSESSQLQIYGQIKTTIPSGGKILITIPTGTSIIQSTALNCSINEPSGIAISSCSSSSSTVTVTLGAQLSVSSSLYIEVFIKNFTNPVSTSRTDTFTFTSTYANSSIIDNQTSNIKLTATSGTLSDAKIITSSQIAGEYSTATVSITLAHQVTVGGTIEVTMPKWNPDASSEDQVEYITSSTPT